MTEEKRAAIGKVIQEIDLYEGDNIVKGEHPLWTAVVALEKHCVFNPRSDAQPYRLGPPATKRWLYGLWASRGERLVPVEEERNGYNFRNGGKPDSKLAIAWMMKLRETLIAWLESP